MTKEIKDSELKAKVTTTVHDDFLIAGKHLGFHDRSAYLRFIIHRELYGINSQLHITRLPGAYIGQENDEL